MREVHSSNCYPLWCDSGVHSRAPIRHGDTTMSAGAALAAPPPAAGCKTAVTPGGPCAGTKAIVYESNHPNNDFHKTQSRTGRFDAPAALSVGIALIEVCIKAALRSGPWCPSGPAIWPMGGDRARTAARHWPMGFDSPAPVRSRVRYQSQLHERPPDRNDLAHESTSNHREAKQLVREGRTRKNRRQNHPNTALSKGYCKTRLHLIGALGP
ncbi:hypothetical protein EVAR_7969_1 [Eumeta japonica]|uniref:Uncharacterized protein n=1 Tax=Eumeta variegata TaxID=151549 RepID=A0A4C1TGW8_EUMVA|nr:hypothetical protein EVAR_7969_1 [Eumeta japonica]